MVGQDANVQFVKLQLHMSGFCMSGVRVYGATYTNASEECDGKSTFLSVTTYVFSHPYLLFPPCVW